MTRKPNLLDLYCCGGGAGFGYEQAGFEVTGIDINPQPKHRGAINESDKKQKEMEFMCNYGFYTGVLLGGVITFLIPLRWMKRGKDHCGPYPSTPKH